MDRHAKRKADGEVLAGPPRHYKRAKRKGCDDTADTDYSMTLSDRPIEVHQLIFSYIESIEEVICLSLANRHFWKVGRERMHDIYASFLGRWAGKNIVCVGEDVQPDDYPPGLFSAEELDVLRHKTSDIPYDFDYPDDVADPNVSFSLHHFTHFRHGRRRLSLQQVVEFSWPLLDDGYLQGRCICFDMFGNASKRGDLLPQSPAMDSSELDGKGVCPFGSHCPKTGIHPWTQH